FVLRDNDPQRLHLKDAGVRAVQGASQVVKKELAFEDAPQVIAKVLALLFVHRYPASRGPPLMRAYEAGLRSDWSCLRRSRSCRYRSAIVSSKGLCSGPGIKPRYSAPQR